MSADDLDALQRKLDVRAEETMRAVAEHERDARLAVAYEELRRGCRGTGDLPPPWHEFYALAREREAMDAVWTEPARRSLRALRDHLSEYLHLPSFDHVLFALAVAVSADLDIGDPLWGLIIGPPSRLRRSRSA